MEELIRIENEVVGCRRCPRLRDYCERIARERRRAFADETYWGRPVPGFGDAQARVLIVGLAPAAHGGNRTGRVFTGDRSGDFLFSALYRTGFANQAASMRKNDGLKLRGCFVTAAVRCAPPGNKPLPAEFENCRSYLERELRALSRLRVLVSLGRLAHDQLLQALLELGWIARRRDYPFGHGVEYRIGRSSGRSARGGVSARGDLPDLGRRGGISLLGCYHPSQQNTFTRKLTEAMIVRVFNRARTLAGQFH
jgi:uracil-DNA glycosylase family 4